ncbi:MAG: glycoside hydrolase family 43 protein [Sphingobium sp.]|nr:glycoside hydrolase family 43 protein [Sphingobium sp.]
MKCSLEDATRRDALAAIASGVVASCPGTSRAGAADYVDQIRPGAIWPDNNGIHINAHGGGVLHHGDRYWWFGEHKTRGKGGNVANVGVHVYSSRDLCNWRDEGIALKVSPDPSSDIARGCILERPKVLYNPRTSKFVMWFHLELKGEGYKAARAGVAVSDSPAGPYEYLRSGRVNPGIWPVNAAPADKLPGTILARDFAGGQMARDMTLFLDDDGRAYHIYASEENQTLQVARLADNWLHHDGSYARILPGLSNEAPAIFKARGRYFLFASGTTGWAPNPARLYAAEHIFGPWTSLGNPVRGSQEQVATTFMGQSSFVLPLPPSDADGQRFVFMADRWRPTNAIDGRYIWLPIDWEGDHPVLRWQDRWTITSG